MCWRAAACSAEELIGSGSNLIVSSNPIVVSQSFQCATALQLLENAAVFAFDSSSAWLDEFRSLIHKPTEKDRVRVADGRTR